MSYHNRNSAQFFWQPIGSWEGVEFGTEIAVSKIVMAAQLPPLLVNSQGGKAKERRSATDRRTQPPVQKSMRCQAVKI